MKSGRPVFLVHEDDLGGAVMHRLIKEVRPQLVVDRSIITHGNARLLSGVAKYAAASRAGIPHIVFTDLDRSNCAPGLLAEWSVPKLDGLMLFRIAVREVEAWLLADREGLAGFLAVHIAKVPVRPDDCSDPKEVLLNLVRRSRSGRLKRDMLPVIGSSASIGPLYNEILGNFVHSLWDWELSLIHI